MSRLAKRIGRIRPDRRDCGLLAGGRKSVARLWLHSGLCRSRYPSSPESVTPINIDTRIKFRHLTCFLEIARQRSFARAADSLAVSQPAISKTLKELEEILDHPLFERGKGGVTLTPVGETFLRYAGPCVQALHDGVGVVAAISRWLERCASARW